MNDKYYAASPPAQHTEPAAAAVALSFDTYSDFVTYITGRKCPSCNAAFVQNGKDVDALFKSWLGETPISSHVRCETCSNTTCIACAGRSGMPVMYDTGTAKMSWCCSRGRLFLVWVMLCGFDQVYCDRQRLEASTSGHASKAKMGSGVGYSSSEDIHFNSFSGCFEQRSKAPLLKDGKKEQAESVERKSDHFDEAIFSALGVLCPSPHHDRGSSSFDVSPPRAVVSMLVHSKILNRAAELLRNDNLDNVTQRKDLYMSLISFLKRVGVHQVSKNDIIFKERIVLALKDNLLTLSFQGPPPRTTETASSLAKGLERLSIQSDTMLRGALSNRNEFQDKRGQDMLWLCREISDLSTYLMIEEWFARRCGKPTSQIPDSAVMEVPDQEFWKTFRFTSQAQALRESRAGRIRRLITEITTIKTGLPAGIYVKHAMSRLDCMAILIVGPQGTPYENGLYEFDLFCGAEFPYKPPSMFFRYPQGCPSSVNPNLHLDDGTVCLSLLGTWIIGAEGELWQPGQSTILQVLISVQAMIFCEDPRRNDPNHQQNPPTSMDWSASRFNQSIRVLTIKYFMLHYAQNVPVLWKYIVENHFRTEGNKCLKIAEGWAKECSQSQDRGLGLYEENSQPMLYGQHDRMQGKRTFTSGRATTSMTDSIDMGPLLEMLQAALSKYGATYVPEKIAPNSFAPASSPVWSGFQRPYERWWL